MQKQMTQIAGISGLVVIFVLAAFHQVHFRWVAGVILILVILAIRNWLGEVTRKTEIILMIICVMFILLTIIFLF